MKTTGTTALVAFQSSLDIQTARLNPLGVKRNSQADLKKNTTDKISAQNIAEYLVAHPEKVVLSAARSTGRVEKAMGLCPDADQAAHPVFKSV